MSIYRQLDDLYSYLNEQLFEEVLGHQVPSCFFTLQRKNNVFSANNLHAFVNLQDGSSLHEIILNPEYFGIKPRIALLQAMVHQMMHLYQYEYGEVSKPGSHDEQYMDFMNAIGLMPSSTGLPDGKPLGGKKMFNYPMPDGVFLDVANSAAQKGLLIDWIEETLPKHITVDALVKEIHVVNELLGDFADPSLLSVPVLVRTNIDMERLLSDEIASILGLQTAGERKPPEKKKVRFKYQCSCETVLWGGRDLNVICGVCQLSFKCETMEVEQNVVGADY